MTGPFSTLVGRGIRRGLVGGHRGWQVALAVGLVSRLFSALGRRRSTVHRIRVEVGEGLEVRHLAEGGDDG